jgi:ribosomal protein S24E|tara:strand:- start:231 stop:596 length:366 start_codon:yes stop_codon:yes gene_type:complete
VEIIERKENPALDRVELTFQWNHSGQATPSRSQMRDAAAKAEPGAIKAQVFIKNVNTRFGMSKTTGLALIYGSEEASSIEPEYVRSRYDQLSEKVEPKEKKTEESEPNEAESEESDGEGDA